MSVRRACSGVLLAAVVSASASAHATSGQDIATAQALFDEAKRLMKAGKFAEACPKFTESQRLDPAAGTMVALALCHESEGKTASAWAEFGEVLSDARRDKRADREQAAQQHLKVLEPKLTRVVVTVVAEVPGLEVRRDGAVLGKAQWGVAIPIDPGTHAFEATAPGKTPWTATGDLSGEGKTLEVRVPQLQDLPAPPPVAPPPTTSAMQAAPPPPPTASTSPQLPPPALESVGSTQRTVGLVVGAAGVVGVGVGTYFALHASSLWDTAHAACPANKCTDSASVTKGRDASSAANAATVLLGIGGVALAAGVVIFVTAPNASSAPGTDKRTGRVYIAPTLGGVVLGGSL